MTQITRVPRGLQHFLGTQAFGKNPSEFGDIVLPTLGIDKFLAVYEERWAAVGVGVFTANTTATITVPDNQIWLLRSVGMEHKASSASVGDTYTLSFSLSKNVNAEIPAQTHAIGQPYIYTVRAGGGSVYNSRALTETVAPSGSVITFHFSEVNGAANFSGTAFCRYLRLIV